MHHHQNDRNVWNMSQNLIFPCVAYVMRNLFFRILVDTAASAGSFEMSQLFPLIESATGCCGIKLQLYMQS